MTATTLPLLSLATLALPVWFAWDPLLSYFTAAVLLVLGVAIAIKKAPPQASVLEKLILLGPVFVAMPMAVFGTEHFLFPTSISQMVPAWIPAHIFWVYLVGTCLILGGLSIVVQKYACLSAGLFGVMMLLFELLMNIPAAVATPHDRFAWVFVFRETSFGAGALAFAATQTKQWKANGTHWIITAARVEFGVAVIFYAVQQFLHPECVPAIPLKLVTPTSIPGHLLWPYLTGIVYVVAGTGLILNRKARLAAAAIGLWVLFIVIMVYVPIMVQKPDIGTGLNYLTDTLVFSGAALCLAGSLREPSAAQSSSLD